MKDSLALSNKAQSEILIKSGTKKILIEFRQIIYVQGLKDYTILQTEGKKYVVKGSLKVFEQKLPKSCFMRVHKSFILPTDKIKSIQRNRIELKDISIPIGRHYKNIVDNFLSAKGNQDPI